MAAHMTKCKSLCPFFQLQSKSCCLKQLEFSRIVIRRYDLTFLDGYRSFTSSVAAFTSPFNKFIAPAPPGFSMCLRSLSGGLIFDPIKTRPNRNVKDNGDTLKYGIRFGSYLASLVSLVAGVLLVSSDTVTAQDHSENKVDDGVHAGLFDVNWEDVFKHSYSMESLYMDEINDFDFEDEQTTVSLLLALYHHRKLSSLVLEDHLEGVVHIDGFECEPQECGGRFFLHPGSFETFSPAWLFLLQKSSGTALAASTSLVKMAWSYRMLLTKAYMTELEKRLQRLEAAKERSLRLASPSDAAATCAGGLLALSRGTEEQEYRQKEALLLGRLERLDPILKELTEGLDSLREGCRRLGARQAEQLAREETQRQRDENDALESEIVLIKRSILEAKLVLRQWGLTPPEESGPLEDSAQGGEEALVHPKVFNWLRSLLIKKESRSEMIEETIMEETEQMKAQKALRETDVVRGVEDGLQELVGPEFEPKADASLEDKEKGSPRRPKEGKTPAHRYIFRRP